MDPKTLKAQYIATSGPEILRLLEQVASEMGEIDQEQVRALVTAGEMCDALKLLCARLGERSVAVTPRVRHELQWIVRFFGLDEALLNTLQTRGERLREHTGLCLLLESFHAYLDGRWRLEQLWPNVHHCATESLADVPDAVRQQVRLAWNVVEGLRGVSPLVPKEEERRMIEGALTAVERAIDEESPFYADPDYPRPRTPRVDFVRPLLLRSAAGDEVTATLTTYVPLHYWHAPRGKTHRLDIAGGELNLSAFGVDVWEAFRALRLQLEARGLLAVCYGASKNVWPSGMSRSMSGGVLAYRHPLDSPRLLSMEDLVTIFETGPEVLPCTVAEQEAFMQDQLARWRADGTEGAADNR